MKGQGPGAGRVRGAPGMVGGMQTDGTEARRAPASAVVVSTGRTATKALAAWAGTELEGVRAWHEPFPSRLLRPLCHLYAAGNLSADATVRLLKAAHRLRRRAMTGRRCFEASPYLRACVELLPRVYDDPLVVHMVRDPRAYVTSYINHGAFSGVKGFFGELLPFWQLKPEHLDPACERSWRTMSPHERVCWRWNALNRLIEEGARSLPADRYLRLRFEDVIDPERDGLAPLVDALGLALDRGGRRVTLDIRANESRSAVHPRAGDWSDEMNAVLESHCGERMRAYGYA